MEASAAKERKQPSPNHLACFSFAHQAISMTARVNNQVCVIAKETRLMDQWLKKLLLRAAS